ncbi:ATP-dependent protease ATPase subunit HslU [Peptococcus simiae]|uniref:ATP-dependent protease ATPase subunit HslU n=1 Tax=Peptococcus simiae TaxID=1643805 RepID=UPI00397F8717
MKSDLQVPNLLPKEMVAYLDRHIIGQGEAKKSVAIAIRNRYRRSRLPEDWQEEVAPSNIIMMGPTGVGKTEIVRRISKILGTPFVKVEATKFTEVGYVGRDVESMIRDLAEAAVRTVREQQFEEVKDEAQRLANDRLLDILVPKKTLRQRASDAGNPLELIFGGTADKDNPLLTDSVDEVNERNDKRTIFREKLKRMELEDEVVEIEVEEKPMTNDLMAQSGMDQVMDNMNDLMKKVMPDKKKKRRMTIAEARKILTEQEADKLLDDDAVAEEAIKLAENHGIVFIDELDKIANAHGGSGPDISREGVQRDILPIVEGSVVKTKYGNLRTDHVLFIAAGAFHVAKPDDLIPELLGRFPVKVRLSSLSEEDFVQILTNTDYSLIDQYRKILATEDCVAEFTEDGIAELAHIAYLMNASEQDLGARRLVTVMEDMLTEALYQAGEAACTLRIDQAYVRTHVAYAGEEHDYSKYLI